MVSQINGKLVGWANYFSLGPVSKAYHAIEEYTKQRLRRWLCEKHKVQSAGWNRYPDEYLHTQLGRLGNGYATAKSQHIFRDFIDAVAHVMIDEREITVRFQKRAHNPLALAAGFAKSEVPVPWLGKKRLRLLFG